jgi:hypothetical protein
LTFVTNNFQNINKIWTKKMAENGTSDLNKVTVVLGSQWGDEGKGKIVDLLASQADVVCRCQVFDRLNTNSYLRLNHIMTH